MAAVACADIMSIWLDLHECAAFLKVFNENLTALSSGKTFILAA